MRTLFGRLEEKFLQDDCPDLASAALVASGVNTSSALRSALKKLDALLGQAFSKLELQREDDLGKAEGLFRWLWLTKPVRYEPGGTFRLHHVLEAQVDPQRPKVGNCLGLTLLYNSLAQRVGLEVSAVYLVNASSKGPHVISLFTFQGKRYDVDNSVPYGFGFAGLLQEPERMPWGNRELIAELLTAVGNERLNGDNARNALTWYRKALALAPNHPSAHLNAGIALAEMGQGEEAEALFRGEGLERLQRLP